MMYNNIAGIYRDLKDYTTALYYYRKALPAFTEKLGELHPHTKAIMKSVAEMEAYVVASKR